RVQREACERRTSVATPADAPLTGEKWQRRQAVAVGRDTVDRASQLVIAGRKRQRLATPREHVAALGRRPADETPRTIDAISPEAPRRLRRRAEPLDLRQSHGGRCADIERDPVGSGAVGADVRAGAVAVSRVPAHPRELWPAGGIAADEPCRRS